MVPIIDFVFSLISALIQLLIWAIIINAILSWLVAFDVINLRNRFVYQFTRFLEAVTRPVMRPVQKIIPSFGGVDISPIIVILVLGLVDAKLLTPLKFYLMATL
jgi:YggT family protein